MIRIVAAVAVLAILAGVVYFSVLRPDPVPVTVYVVARGQVDSTVTNSKAGTVRSRHRATLSPEIGGRVVALPVRDGDRVAAGDVLLRLADDDYRAELELRERQRVTAESSRRQACLAAEQAVREHERYLRLRDDDIVSAELLEQLASQREVAAAACEAARDRVYEADAARDLARTMLGKTVTRAPFDAIVAEVSVELGEWITPSPPGVPIPPVIELIQPDAIYVSAPLDEVDLGRVLRGQPAVITMDAYPGREFRGTVTRIAPYVLDTEEHSRTVEIEVEFDAADSSETLLPGASADVEVILDSRDDVLRVPSYALIQGKHVLVITDGVLERIPVETGLANWAFTEIVSGLDAGQRVVVSLDRAEVQEGARAEVAEETDR